MSTDSHIDYAGDDELVGQFVTWTEDAVTEMRQILSDLPDENKRGDEPIQRVYDLTHNIKGMGASFDFELLTSIGVSLCGYMKSLGETDPISKKAIEAHVRAFEVVMQHRITGDGGAQGAALTDRLQVIVAEAG